MTNDWDRASTIATCLNEPDERYALAVGIEAGLCRNTPVMTDQIRAELPYYLAGKYAGYIVRYLTPVFRQRSKKLVGSFGSVFDEPSETHAFIIGVDIGWTGVTFYPGDYTEEQLFDVSRSNNYYVSGVSLGKLAKRLIPIFNVWMKIRGYDNNRED